jgi:hypothetical protein
MTLPFLELTCTGLEECHVIYTSSTHKQKILFSTQYSNIRMKRTPSTSMYLCCTYAQCYRWSEAKDEYEGECSILLQPELSDASGLGITATDSSPSAVVYTQQKEPAK